MASKYYDFYKDIIEKSAKTEIPVSGFFEITSRCNLHCRMCYVCSASNDKYILGKELTTEQWISLGKQARDAGMLFLTLTGGEIFVREDFWEIYEAYTQMGFIITLFTNGTLLNNNRIERLKKNPPSKVSITIYGADMQSYEKVTGHPEAYEKTIVAVKGLISAGIDVQIKTTVIQCNKGDFQQLAIFANNLGLNMGLVNYVAARREREGTDPLGNRLSPLELAKYEKNASDFIKSLHNSGENAEESVLITDDDAMADEVSEVMKDHSALPTDGRSAFKCAAGRYGFWLSWDGKMSPCGLLSEPCTEPLKYGFKNAWEDLKVLSKQVPVCEECERCSLRSKCMACPARLKGETGFFDKPAPYLCELIKAREILNLKP